MRLAGRSPGDIGESSHPTFPVASANRLTGSRGADGCGQGAGYAPRMSVLPFPSLSRDDQPAEQPTLREALGEVLREERHDQQRTLADVAGAAGVSLPYLSEVERGRKDVSSEVVGSICTALEVPLPVVLRRVADRLSVARASSRTLALAA